MSSFASAAEAVCIPSPDYTKAGIFFKQFLPVKIEGALPERLGLRQKKAEGLHPPPCGCYLFSKERIQLFLLFIHYSLKTRIVKLGIKVIQHLLRIHGA